MLYKTLEAIIKALIVIHQENIAIARELTGNEGIEAVWNEMFFSSLRDIATIDRGDTAEGKQGEEVKPDDVPDVTGQEHSV